MRILKIFNNNVVSTITDEKKEAIAQGAGVGFKKKPGDEIEKARIEKLFILHDAERARFNKLMEDTPIEYFQIAHEIVERAKNELRIELSNNVLLSLTDHIYFAIERLKQGVSLPNLLLSEVRTLYPKEFAIGMYGLELIHKRTQIKMGVDEAGYIAFHIMNAELNVERESTIKILQLSKGVITIIHDMYGIDLKEDSLDSSRLLTHLKYLGQRIFTEEKVEFVESGDMYDLLILKEKRIEECINSITKFVSDSFSYVLSQEEKVYLMIHLIKIIRPKD